jgi:hypothetical protein
VIHGLYERPDIAIHKRRVFSARVAGGAYIVIGVDHILMSDLFVCKHRFVHVDGPFIGRDLRELVTMPSNIAEVHVENLLPRPEVANDFGNLLTGVLAHFRDSTLAEIQPVILKTAVGTEFEFKPKRDAAAWVAGAA